MNKLLRLNEKRLQILEANSDAEDERVLLVLDWGDGRKTEILGPSKKYLTKKRKRND